MPKPTLNTPGSTVFAAIMVLLLAGFIGLAMLQGSTQNEDLPMQADELDLFEAESVAAHRSDVNKLRPVDDSPIVILSPSARSGSGHILASTTAPLPVKNAAPKKTEQKEVAATPTYDSPPRFVQPTANEDKFRIYVVRPDDTITGIAHRQLRSYQRWREIASINADLLTSPNRLQPGMRLRLPIHETQSSNDPLIFPDLPKSYTIQSGDTLGDLAKRFYNESSKWRLILEANRGAIKEETNLQIGTTLVIPRP